MATLLILFGNISANKTQTTGPIDIAKEPINIKIPIKLSIPSEDEMAGKPAEFTLE